METTIQYPASFCSRRRRSRTLAPLIIPPTQTVEFPQDYDDVVEEGRLLFNQFIHDQLEQEHPGDVTAIAIPVSSDFKNPMWAKAGRELRFMADEFARSSQRNDVKRKAQEVSVNNITYEQFKDLLAELFCQGHITKERIMVLFFFCSDVAVRTLSSSVDLCNKFITWSLSFVTRNVCRWVRDCGGWEDVLVIDRILTVPRPVIVLGAFVFIFFAVRYYRS
ncbi:hypothetical protein SNE40_012600 [Patella caerulea]|uniref:Bcl-2 Bcl-2 homology region 1-3 domain-containing protein n=1 Tax=Patella caerulea TaxID=87958 RepID=A0AAN8PWA1_PATCE